MKKKSKRAPKYPEAIRDRVLAEYPYCTTPDEKQELADSLGMDSLNKLYNLASRLKATRTTNEDDMHMGIEQADDVEAMLLKDQNAKVISKISTTVFTEADDEYLKNHWGNTKLSMISAQRRHSEPALLYRARHLGLRKLQPQWDIKDVSRYISLPEDYLLHISELQIMSTQSSVENKLAHKFVSTINLYNWIQTVDLMQDSNGSVDEFFLKELEESHDGIMNLRERWEGCKFITPDHRCSNPASFNSYGLYCAKVEGQHEAGEDPKCQARLIPLNKTKVFKMKELPILDINVNRES